MQYRSDTLLSFEVSHWEEIWGSSSIIEFFDKEIRINFIINPDHGNYFQ
jgi:hypothetical protein